ncbi:MAG TPA: hypothetical protein VFP61_01250 [Acidimicrobiales bacterium]|nr:hypothetical protein [Acidimicrobiales bacterium]
MSRIAATAAGLGVGLAALLGAAPLAAAAPGAATGVQTATIGLAAGPGGAGGSARIAIEDPSGTARTDSVTVWDRSSAPARVVLGVVPVAHQAGRWQVGGPINALAAHLRLSTRTVVLAPGERRTVTLALPALAGPVQWAAVTAAQADATTAGALSVSERLALLVSDGGGRPAARSIPMAVSAAAGALLAAVGGGALLEAAGHRRRRG